MIQGNVSAHASIQTCVLLVFYLHWLPGVGGEGFNLLTPCILQTGRAVLWGCATTEGLGMGMGTGDNCFQETEPSPQVTLSASG